MEGEVGGEVGRWWDGGCRDHAIIPMDKAHLKVNVTVPTDLYRNPSLPLASTSSDPSVLAQLRLRCSIPLSPSWSRPSPPSPVPSSTGPAPFHPGPAPSHSGPAPCPSIQVQHCPSMFHSKLRTDQFQHTSPYSFSYPCRTDLVRPGRPDRPPPVSAVESARLVYP